MAHGCAVWPAYWSVGYPWPDAGELDIIEGVNLKLSFVFGCLPFLFVLSWLTSEFRNQYTLHTGQGSDCVLVKDPPMASGGVPYTGNVMGLECRSSADSDQGCPFLDSKNTSFGHGFNMAGGGVFAHLLDSTGLKMWHFERQSIPQDIQQGHPDPSSWPTPAAFWSSLGCDFASHLYDQHLVINTALSGGWASGDYPNSGCPATPSDQIAKGSNFNSAFLGVPCISCSADRETRCKMDDQLHRCL